MTLAERTGRSRAADAWCREALEAALGSEGSESPGVALVAVGGYGREELAPYSDLDVVLVHADEVEVSDTAAQVWYPLWDRGVDLDHSVRSLSAVTRAAADDPRVALGLLDARHVAGDPSVTLRLRTDLLAHWRRDARRQLPALRRMMLTRVERSGELAHASIPDLKESLGGLRDATVLKALVATWLVDVPHSDLERSRRRLLDVRDALHAVLGRAGDRVQPEVWSDLAAHLGLPDAEAAQRDVRLVGRRITHLSRLTWRRVDAALARPASVGGVRRPALDPVAPGVAVSSGEVVLDRGARPGSDPLLLLRAAAEAAGRGLALSPATAARLARDGAAPAAPWDEEARRLLTRLLAAGPGLLDVWETLDETGALDRLLPEWERVRLLPHASQVHRFTVDRHLVETCIEAAGLIRRVGRPDLLMTAALLHDIGKGGTTDHSVAGAPLAAAVAARVGFAAADAELVARLVRHHLLLATTATTRDLEDPATAAGVAELVRDEETLDLLAALTEADARATSGHAWTSWRAALVGDLVRRTRAVLRGTGAGTAASREEPVQAPVPAAVRDDPGHVEVVARSTEHGCSVGMVSGDRVGFMADAAAALAVQRIPVRSARAWTQGPFAFVTWEVGEEYVDPAVLRLRLEAIRSGRLDPTARLRDRSGSTLEPTVLVRHDASADATVLEVRGEDRPGLLHAVCRALAGLEVSVRSAHVSTLGPQAVDVFYVGEPGARGLSDERAASAAHAVRDALTPTVTLDA